jgi:hypothetical protein
MLNSKKTTSDALQKFIKNFEETYGLKQKFAGTRRQRGNKSPLKVHPTETSKRSTSKF